MRIPTHIAGDDHCVMCGEPVPEGRMVCGLCESNVLEDESSEYDLPLRKGRKRFFPVSAKTYF